MGKIFGIEIPPWGNKEEPPRVDSGLTAAIENDAANARKITGDSKAKQEERWAANKKAHDEDNRMKPPPDVDVANLPTPDRRDPDITRDLNRKASATALRDESRREEQQRTVGGVTESPPDREPLPEAPPRKDGQGGGMPAGGIRPYREGDPDGAAANIEKRTADAPKQTLKEAIAANPDLKPDSSSDI